MTETRLLSLHSGIPVVVRNIETSNSISIGIYTKTGLIQEPRDANGIAHFLEHMVFKGTQKRTGKQITEEVDQMGGVINAQTSKETTSYYMTVLPHGFKKAVDILSDLYLNATLEKEDMAREKHVVLEEINMYDDTPDDNIHDVFSSTVWNKSKLGLPILGTEKSLKNITQKTLKSFRENYYNPKNILISIAGKVPDEKTLLKTLEDAFKFNTSAIKPYSEYRPSLNPNSSVTVVNKDIEQVHFCLGGQGLPYAHKDHYKATLLSTLLGGSMSSRLFQEIREKRGWAYSIYAYASFYKHGGLFTVYAGVNKDKYEESIKIVLNELDKVRQKPITQKECRRIKEQLKGNLILSLEQSASWMTWQARTMILEGKVYSIKDVTEEIEKISPVDIQKIAQKLFKTDTFSLAVLGPLKTKESEWNGQTLGDVLGIQKIRF